MAEKILTFIYYIYLNTSYSQSIWNNTRNNYFSLFFINSNLRSDNKNQFTHRYLLSSESCVLRGTFFANIEQWSKGLNKCSLCNELILTHQYILGRRNFHPSNKVARCSISESKSSIRAFLFREKPTLWMRFLWNYRFSKWGFPFENSSTGRQFWMTVNEFRTFRVSTTVFYACAHFFYLLLTSSREWLNFLRKCTTSTCFSSTKTVGV